MTAFRLSHQTILKFCFLWALGISLYAQTLNDPFHFDDTVTIVGNRAVQLLPDWSQTVKEILAFQPSRFVTNISFAVNYYFGRLDTWGYHAINIALHLAAACLVWWLGNLFVLMNNPTGETDRVIPARKGKSSRKKSLDRSSDSKIFSNAQLPFLAALIFLVHPVNTQAVTYISQRSEALAALFYVASVCCYIKGRTTEDLRTPYFILAVVSGLLASFSKETAITLPIMIMTIELFFFGKNNNALPRTILFGVLGLGFLLLIPAAFQFNYFDMLSRSYLSQSHLGDVLTLPTYLMTQARVFVTFLRLVFVPVGLNLDHDYPMVSSFFDPAFLGSLCLLVAIAVAAFRIRNKNPMLSFAAVWFFLTLSSNLVPRAHVMFEHKLYLVLTGMVPALVLGFGAVVRNRKAIVIAVCCLIAAFSVLTFLRNRVWDSEIALWEDVYKKSPNKARVHLSLGSAYLNDGKYEKAIALFTRVIRTTDEPYRAYTNRGAAYVKMNKDDLAIEDFNQAIALEPRFVDAYLNRAEVLARMKDFAAAFKDIDQAINLDPQKSVAYRMRGRIFDALRQYDKAWADYNKALAIDPGDARSLAWRGYLHAMAGRSEEAYADFNAALRFDPSFSEAYVYRGMSLKDRRKFQEALNDFNKAISLAPTSSLAYYQRASALFDMGDLPLARQDVDTAIVHDPNYDLPYSLRGIIYARQRNYNDALSDFNKAIMINPEFAQHYFNRSKLYKELGKTDEMITDARKARSLGFPVPEALLGEGR